MNPIQPPDAPLADTHGSVGSPIKAVLLGLLVDIGGTLLFGLIFGVAYGFHLSSIGVPTSEMQEQLAAATQTGWAFALNVAVGCGFSVLGGYLCARISRRRDYKLGYILAFLCVGFGVALGAGSINGLQLALLSAVTVACVLLGTKIGIARVNA